MMTSFHESVPLLEPHSAQLGGGALRAMLLLSPRLLSMFLFADDERCHALSSSYNGHLPALQPGQWRVLFREVLRVSIPQEVVFKFDCPLSSWALRLVDQTTATELPSSLQSSQLYLLNSNTDYLLLGEAWLPSEATKESVEEAWHLWLISASSLPSITTAVKQLGEPSDPDLPQSIGVQQISTELMAPSSPTPATESFAQHFCSICYEPLTEPFVANSRRLYYQKCCDCSIFTDTSKNAIVLQASPIMRNRRIAPTDSEHSQSTLLGLQERLQVGQ